MFILAISDICSDVFPFRFGVPLPAPPERIAATPVTVQSGDYLELPSKYAGKRLRFFFVVVASHTAFSACPRENKQMYVMCL